MEEVKAGGRLTAPEPLSDRHDLTRFDCGKPPLNDWLRNHALASEGRTSRAYGVCEGAIVVGYYCLSAGSVERSALPTKMKRTQGLPKQIPVTVLGRLARDVRYRGTGLGEDLLQDAFVRTLSASRTVGIRAVLVHSLDEDAGQFWKDHEFIEYPAGSRTFFLPIETIVDAL